MGKSERDILRLLSELYATGIGERSWLDTLGSISTFFGAAGANAFDFSRLTKEPLTCYIGDGNDIGRSDYIDHIHSIDPRLKHAIAHRGPLISCDYDVLPEEAMRRHEYYDWLGRVCDMKYHVGTKFIDDGDVFSCVSIELGTRRGPAEREEFELLELLTPHIANSWRISQRLAQAARIDDFNLLLLENAPWGVVTLDHSGRVLSVNGPAQRIVARGDGLRITRGELRARRAADDRALQSEIGLSLKAARGEGYYSGGTMAIGRAGEAIPYGLRVLPLRHVTGFMPQAVPFVAVVIADLVQPELPGHEDLMAVFGFSPREAEIALLVVQGLSLAEIAGSLRIAPGTARSHLANAMAKAGTHSQAALTGLIRGLPPQDERP
jgi:DNA-binding CsgD family transcriptional regulator